MKLIIFGATGTIGRFLVAQALEKGFDVTAFTRSATRITSPSSNLRIVEGDVLDPAAVSAAVEGQDAVICALGMPLLNKEGLRSAGTRNIVNAMAASGVKRLVCLSGLGAGDSWNMLPFHYRYIIVPLLMRRLFADHNAQESHVRQSPLDWILVRPSNFAKGRPSRPYAHGFSKLAADATLKISPPDVADFMLQQVTSDAYLHQAPGLSS